MRQFFAFILFLVFAGNSYGQNMVLNPSFEQYTTCPTGGSQFNSSYLPNWSNPTLATPDYYNACSTSGVNVPFPVIGYQPAYSGNAYGGAACANAIEYYEYLGGNLTALTANAAYEVILHVSLSNHSRWATSDIGVYFYQTTIGVNTSIMTHLPVYPQIAYSSYGFISDTMNWVTLVDTFIATNSFDHLIIGNFNSAQNTSYIIVNPNASSAGAYYLFDSIIVRQIPMPPLFASITHTNVNCHNASTGSATVTAWGVPPYTYLWQPGNYTTATISNVTAGTYTCTVTDAASNVVVNTITILQPGLALSASVSNISPATCNGGNGSATVSTTGGTPAYTYQWLPSGFTGTTCTNLSAGTHTINVTDSKGCTTSVTFTITQAPQLTATISNTINATCGSQNGSATVSASGGTLPYTYFWLPTGGSSATAVNLAPGVYTVYVSDSNFCTTTAIVVIGQVAPFTLTTSATNVSCNGQNNGAATVYVTGGTPPFTYLWSNSQSTQTATNLSSGTYTVSVTDANGCIGTATVNITQPPVLSVSVSSVTHINCYGQNTGTATVSVSGGTPGYTYLWSNGNTTPGIAGLVAGTYTCTVTDSKGCIATTSVTINQSPQLNLVVTSLTNAACNQNTGSATVSASGGTPGYTYNWQPYGGTGTSASNLGAGIFTVTVTDTKGCTDTAHVVISTTTPLNVSVTATTNISCNGGNNGTASVNVTGGTQPYTYNWSNGGTTSSISNLVAGAYTVIVTDINGCAGTATVTITQPPLLNATIGAITNIACNGQSNGSTSVSVTGGSPGYTYQWSPTGGIGTTASNLTAGTYTITVTDSKGCIDTAHATITQPQVLNVSINSASATCSQNNGLAGAVVSGGTAPYTYLWSTNQTTANISNLSGGTYTVTVTDAHNCTGIAIVTITQSANLTLNIDVTNISCNGLTNGSATVNVSTGTLPYTYNWSNGGTIQTISNLSAGTYTINVSDAVNCQGTATVTITEPTALTSSIIASTDVLCNGGQTGATTVSANGGTTPYTYVWSNGGTTANQINLAAGNYSVTVIDSNGCTSISSVTINEPSAISISTQVTAHSCTNETQGSASATASGGTPPYSYSWNTVPQQTTNSVNGLAPGTYIITITDGNNCINTATVVINPYPIPNVYAGNDTIICFGKDAAYLQATGAVSYQWSPPAGLSCTACPDPVATPTASTTYTVTGTDANGCIGSDIVNVAVQVKNPTSVGAGKDICIGESTQLFAEGGFEYSWSPTLNMQGETGATPIVAPEVTTTYTVLIKQSECYTDTLTQTVTVFTPPSVNLGPDRREVTGTTAILNADTLNATSLLWTPPLNLSCYDCINPEAYIEKDIRYVVTVYNGPCISVDDINISVSCDKGDVWCANSFTPNKDGNNDFFYPQSSSRILIAQMAIYDRWGEKIFTRSNFFTNEPTDGWNGTYKGKDCVPEVYSYFIQFYCGNGQKMLMKGDINIIK